MYNCSLICRVFWGQEAKKRNRTNMWLQNCTIRFRFMVFKATFNNISVISWRSILLVEETGVTGENHRPVIDKHHHIMLYRLLNHVLHIGLFWMNIQYDFNYVQKITWRCPSGLSIFNYISNILAFENKSSWDLKFYEFTDLFFNILICRAIT